MIHILTALQCEAKPLKIRYRLSRLMDEQAFDVYRNDDLTLTVSGVGKTAMAAATAYTYALFGKNGLSTWLNIGIAGHSSYTPGRVFIANKIIDEDKGKHWFPPLIYSPPCPTESLRTVSKPEFAYKKTDLYDMEAAGFYETATRFATGELIQCLKIVSDNKRSDKAPLSARFVADLIGRHLETVDTLVELQRGLARLLEEPEPPQLSTITQRWHFSTEQRRQLTQLLNRWELLSSGQGLDIQSQPCSASAKMVLRWVREQVEQLPVAL